MLSIKYNFLFSIFNTVLNLLFPLLTFVYVSKIIGPEFLGRVNFINTFANYFILFGFFGMNLYGVRQISRVRENENELNKTFNELFLINIITITISIILYNLIIIIFSFFKNNLNFYYFNLISIFLSIFSIDWYFQGIENYKFITLRNLIVKSVVLFLIFLFVKNKEQYMLYYVLNILGIGFNYIFNIFYIKNIILFKNINLRNIIFHFKKLYKFAVISFITSIYIGLDKIFLGFMSGDYYVGLYTPAEKISRLSLGIVSAASSVLFPRISNYFYKNNINKTKKIISESLHVLLLVSIPVFLIIEVLAYRIIYIISGKEYIESVLTLRIEAIIIIPITIATLAGFNVLIANNQENKYLISILCGSIFFVISSFVFIPIYKHNGAAISMCIAEIVGALMELFFARKWISGIKIWIYKLLFSNMIVFFVLIILNNLLNYNIVSFILIVILNLALYICILYYLKDSIIIKCLNKI